ncbi:uncharacterized protein LOC124460492 [Drosophila willistoni]|uniref:uncharacterized protein LOC124460492 n=1 Tax=Drosophila willistoni TaxID=7260 RepID=UPI001F07B285|nr:uncharacterized protein LOC124460492 [Drosophila willistoni]
MSKSELTLQQILHLREVQMRMIKSRAEYLRLYRAIVKKAMTTELTELVNGDYNIISAELNVPKELPQMLGTQRDKEQYTPMIQLDMLEELYDAAEEGFEMLKS